MLLLPHHVDLIGLIVAVTICLVAAITDLRTGKIYNWLTFPFLIAPPIVLGIALGWPALVTSVLGIFGCGLIFYVLFRFGGGGGDVKVLAAVGACVGVQRGMQVVIAGVMVAGLYSIVRMAWEGKLLRTLLNVLTILINPLLPAKHKRTIRREQMSNIRMGPAFFAGALATLLYAHPELYGP